jgi:hypothetical protein
VGSLLLLCPECISHAGLRLRFLVACGVFVSSVEGSSISESSLVLIRGGSGSEEWIGAEEGFCFEEDSPRSSKGLWLRGGLVINEGAFLDGDFGAGFFLEGSAKGWEPEVLHEIHYFFPLVFFL